MITPIEKKPFAKILHGERLDLVRAHSSYAEVLWKSILRDRKLRGRSWESIRTLDELTKYLKNLETELPEGEVVYLLMKDDTVMGTFHIHSINYPDKKVEIGYAIEKSYEGYGYISEAIPLVEGELKRLGFHRIELSCNVLNKRSSSVAERNGYKLEGIKVHDCIENGSYRDSAFYAKLI